MPESTRQSLDSRCVRAWRAATLLGVLPIVAIGLMVGLLFLLGLPGPLTTIIVVGAWCLILLISSLLIGPMPIWSYRKWSYRIEHDLVDLRHGIVWQTTVSIPISRLQHIDLHVGPLERRLGLASLELHTAGTSNASHTIPGLNHETAVKLRDQLVLASAQGPSGKGPTE